MHTSPPREFVYPQSGFRQSFFFFFFQGLFIFLLMGSVRPLSCFLFLSPLLFFFFFNLSDCPASPRCWKRASRARLFGIAIGLFVIVRLWFLSTVRLWNFSQPMKPIRPPWK